MKSPAAMSQKIIQIQIIKNFRLDIWVEEPKPQKIPKYKLISFLFSHKSNQNRFATKTIEMRKEKMYCATNNTKKREESKSLSNITDDMRVERRTNRMGRNLPFLWVTDLSESKGRNKIRVWVMVSQESAASLPEIGLPTREIWRWGLECEWEWEWECAWRVKVESV